MYVAPMTLLFIFIYKCHFACNKEIGALRRDIGWLVSRWLLLYEMYISQFTVHLRYFNLLMYIQVFVQQFIIINGRSLFLNFAGIASITCNLDSVLAINNICHVSLFGALSYPIVLNLNRNLAKRSVVLGHSNLSLPESRNKRKVYVCR